MAYRRTVVIALATAVTVLFALSPSGATGAKPCSARPNARPCADKTAPTTPGNLAVTGTTATTVTVSWTASSDNVGVTGYTLFRDGGTVTTTTSTGFTYTGLSCATSYVFAVDAYDAAANHSAQASVATSTAACPTDTTPPSTPTGLKQNRQHADQRLARVERVDRQHRRDALQRLPRRRARRHEPRH